MATYSVDINVRKKIFQIPIDPISITYAEPFSNVPTLTNSSISTIANTIATKPQLITRAQLRNLGNNINLVGYDPLIGLVTNSNKTFSPKLLNWVEPYDLDMNGTYKTTFYTEVNSGLKVGDKVFILNGEYDSDLLIQKNKYKKGRDGYKVLYVDNCKITLDIDYTGVLPYKSSIDDDFIKIYYIRNQSEFLHANRSVTTKSGNYENKFSYYNNNIIYVDSAYATNEFWGKNTGVAGSGFYVRSSTASWTNITTPFITTGSYSYATQSNSNRIKVMNADFTYNGKEYKEGFIYKWFVGPTQSEWITDVTYFPPYISKSNFRDGVFNGEWNSGIFGQYYKKINWFGNGSVWNIGTLINTDWKKGTLDSLYTASQSYFSGFDNNGLPYQKANSPNNAGRGYNFVLNSNMNQSTIINGSIYNTTFGTQSTATYSIVENEILGYSTTYLNTIKSAFFNKCEFNNSFIENSELKNTIANNSKFEKVKSINSYFNKSVLKDSSYNSDNIIKIFAYDELTASESSSLAGLTYSNINDVVQKVYKFYIDKNGYERLRTGDAFYLKGIKINDNKKEVINFFDKKFKIGSWTEYIESDFGTVVNGKRGYQYSAFLSSPLDNSYKFTSATFSETSGIKYQTVAYTNNNSSNYYSIDLWISNYDINNSNTGGENLNFNTDMTVYDAGQLQGPNSLGNIVDVTSAYIVDADFDSGLMENSDWNSGSHIESNNDNNITIPSLSGGTYSLSINSSNYIVATTSYSSNYSESNLIGVGDIVFLDSVDFNWGTVSRIPDTYKVISNTNGVYQLKEVGTVSQIISLSASNGSFYTKNAQNRYGHIKKLKIDKTNIKSGFLRRSYITGSLIQNLELNYLDKDFNNLENIKNLVVSDSIFSDNGNILSNATYENSFFLNDGSDMWNSGIIQNSIWVNGTFSNGVIRDSRWINGTFLNGWFYNSRTFNTKASEIVHEQSFVYLDSGMDSYTVNLPSTGVYNIEFTLNSLDDLRISDGNSGGGGGIELDIIGYTGTLINYKNTFTFSTPYLTLWNFLNYPGNISVNGLVVKKVLSPFYYSENINSYYKNGVLPNNRNSWQNGKFLDGEFNKSDWEFGTFSNGRFYYSNFYDGYITNGVLGNNQVSTTDTKIYNGTVSYAIVDNATLYAIDTSFSASASQNITWLNGIFNNGVFGSDISQGASHSAIWYNGSFNGGQFISMAKWKNGTFNGGKFLSAYGWSQSNSTSQLDYGWENGIFNGGEFGNANGLTNSTWYKGEFDGGIFRGRVWNDGVFTYGELQGSGTISSVSGLTCANANAFVDTFSHSYWGLWRNGLVTNTKDRFIKDRKFFTRQLRAVSLERFNAPPKTAKIKNALWLSGTFSHTNGEMNNSVWLDGAFEKGNFVSSSFNPYVERSQFNISPTIYSSELLYNGGFTPSVGWATSSTSTGGYYATFSAGNEYFTPLSYSAAGINGTPGAVTQVAIGSPSIPLPIGTTIIVNQLGGTSFKGVITNDLIFYSVTLTSGTSNTNAITSISVLTSITADYKGGASASGLYLYNTVTRLKPGKYEFDLNILTHSSNINLKVNVGTYSYFNSSAPLTLGSNIFEATTKGGSVSLYVDTNELGGSISIDSLSIKEKMKTFNLNDDTCYWENGTLNNSDFHISEWRNGKFIIGTATGMIWQNGISNYMNAFNVFWENGTWRNGNWYGSSFVYNGSITEDYVLQILDRGEDWSGTSSAHIWNIFLQPGDFEASISSVIAATPSYGATDAVLDITGWVSSGFDPYFIQTAPVIEYISEVRDDLPSSSA
jgi:hypothetical protein